MPGCGKSTLGRKIAKKLNFSFIDLDQYIEEKEGISIPGIFSEKGEVEFRKLESHYLKEIIQTEEQFVLSTGGGTPVFYGNIKLMNKTGLTVYLRLTISEIQHRLLQDGLESRPLFSGLSPKSLEGKLNEMLAEREPFYLQAQVHSDGKGENFGLFKI